MLLTRQRQARLNTLCYLALMLFAADVCAQTPIDGDSVATPIGAPGVLESSSDWSVQLGALIIDWPEYSGADENETTVHPLFTIEYQGRYFIDAIEGIGVHLITGRPFSLDAGVTSDRGRSEDDSIRLAGLGNIDEGSAIKLKAGYRHNAFSYHASVERALSGNDTGFWLDLEVGYTRMWAGKLILNPGLIARYGSSDYTQQYFGVGDVQSADSGLETYTPDAGFATVGLQLNTVRILPNNWSLQGLIKLKRLSGDAADSPIVVDRNQMTIALGIVKTIQ